MAENSQPAQIRMWTFYNPSDGPAAVLIGGQMFTCEGIEIVKPLPQDLRPMHEVYRAEETEVLVTFRLRVPTAELPQYRVETVPAAEPIG